MLFELHVRVEHHIIVEMFNNHEEVLIEKETLKVFKFNQRTNLRDFEEIKKIATLATLTTSNRRWNMLIDSLQKKDPLGYPFFRLPITRSNLYVNSLRRSGTQRLGLRFHYPPI